MSEHKSLTPTHWTGCAANLQKIDSSLSKYLEVELNISFPNEIIDFPSIARDDNKSYMVKLV